MVKEFQLTLLFEKFGIAVFEPAASSDIRPRWNCKFCGGRPMLSTAAHSKLPTHVSNLPENLRPGYRESSVENPILENGGQFDQPETLQAEVESEPERHEEYEMDGQGQQNWLYGVNQYHTDDIDMPAAEDQSELVDIEEERNLVMQEVIDIFQPRNRLEVDEEERGEAEGEGEGEGDGEEDPGWFPFTSLVVSH
jgi:hypothetical protein